MYKIVTDWRKYDRQFAVLDKKGRCIFQTNDKDRAIKFVQECVEDDGWNAANR